jgi:excisionase family DNA binding protein
MVIAMHGNTGTIVATDDQIAYTVKHAAELVDLCERTMWQLVMDREVPSFKVGRARRIARTDLIAYVERRRDDE